MTFTNRTLLLVSRSKLDKLARENSTVPSLTSRLVRNTVLILIHFRPARAYATVIVVCSFAQRFPGQGCRPSAQRRTERRATLVAGVYLIIKQGQTLTSIRHLLIVIVARQPALGLVFSGFGI